MAHAAIAYAKANFRRRIMAATTSIGPGATNLVTACALAHVNRLPLLLLPGDVFANRRPDPVLQQVEDFGDGTVSANDCFRPVSRYFDRITRPEQIIPALARAMQVLTDPADCGPVTLSLCQDVQAEAYDYPESFFAERVWAQRRPRPDRAELEAAAAALKAAKKPLIIAGGGVLYSGASKAARAFVRETRRAGLGDARRKVVAAGRQCAQYGCGRRDRHVGSQPAGRGGRRGSCRRHAHAGFHHRLVGAVQGDGQGDRRPERAALRRRQASRVAAGRRRRSKASMRWRRRSAAGKRPTAWADNARKRQGRVAQGRGSRHRRDQCRTAVGRAGHRRGAARDGRGCDAAACARAGCRASCTSCGRPARPGSYHAEYGYLLHGLRDRRRRSASRWRSRTRRSSSWSATAPI